MSHDEEVPTKTRWIKIGDHYCWSIETLNDTPELKQFIEKDELIECHAINFARYILFNSFRFKGENIKDIYKLYKKEIDNE